MTGRHASCRHLRPHLKRRKVRRATTDDLITNTAAGFTISEETLRLRLPTTIYRGRLPWTWPTEERTLIRVFGVAAILYFIIVALVIVQSIVFML